MGLCAHSPQEDPASGEKLVSPGLLPGEPWTSWHHVVRQGRKRKARRPVLSELLIAAGSACLSAPDAGRLQPAAPSAPTL